MTTYRTPGVYVEEISTFPPSVAQGATAVPAFLGYSEKGPKEPTAINTFLEYQHIFGVAKPTEFAVDTTTDPPTVTMRTLNNPEFLLYYMLSHHFKNGGGRCYVVSLGAAGYPPAPGYLASPLRPFRKSDEALRGRSPRSPLPPGS